MGRPPKDATHPLVRLREKLKVTRKQLAKRAGIPEGSLKDIETGRYTLKPEVAAMVSFATGVDSRSLLEGDDPLRDMRGEPFSKENRGVRDPLALSQQVAKSPDYLEAKVTLLQAAFDTALEKNFALIFSFLFETWLPATMRAFDAEALFFEKLTDRLASFEFDSLQLPAQLHPKNERLTKRWKAIEEQIQRETPPMPPPATGVPIPGNSRLMGQYAPEEYIDNLSKVRTEARKRLRQRLEEAKTTRAFKSGSGRRPRSPNRTRA
jgi:transcriptional regulator with XRE-family HTH domain